MTTNTRKKLGKISPVEMADVHVWIVESASGTGSPHEVTLGRDPRAKRGEDNTFARCTCRGYRSWGHCWALSAALEGWRGE